MATIIGIDARGIIPDPVGYAHLAAWGFAGFADEVNHTAGRVAFEGRGSAAAHGLDPINGRIGFDPAIGVTKRNIAKFDDGQAVFIEMGVFCTTGRDRQAAERHVGIAFAARCF